MVLVNYKLANNKLLVASIKFVLKKVLNKKLNKFFISKQN